MTEQNEAEKVDAVVRKILSVSHKELQKRERAWQRKRARKKWARNLPASGHAGDSKV
jgi:hypothetical protein